MASTNIMGARLRDCKGISRQTCCSLAWLISPEAVSGGEDVGVGEQGASAPVPVVPALQHLQQEQGQGGVGVSSTFTIFCEGTYC